MSIVFDPTEGIVDTDADLKTQLYNLALEHTNRADFYDNVLDLAREAWNEYVQDTKDSADEEAAEGERQGD